jgi:hypothetical protein
MEADVSAPEVFSLQPDRFPLIYNPPPTVSPTTQGNFPSFPSRLQSYLSLQHGCERRQRGYCSPGYRHLSLGHRGRSVFVATLLDGGWIPSMSAVSHWGMVQIGGVAFQIVSPSLGRKPESGSPELLTQTGVRSVLKSK